MRGWVSIANPIVTLYISSSPLRQSALSLCDSPLFQFLFLFSFFHFPLLQSLPVPSWFSPCISSITWGLYFLTAGRASPPQKTGREIQWWPQFSAHFSHKNLKELWGRGRGLVPWWTPEDIQKYENINPAWNSARACGTAGNQSRERHDGIFLLRSVTLLTAKSLDVPSLWFSEWRSRQVSGQNICSFQASSRD